MAGRGFLIEELTKPHGIQLYMPDFNVQSEQLRPYYVAHSRRISNIRIHVEIAIGRVKEYKIPNQIHSTHLLPQLNEIFYICWLLSSFDDILIKQKHIS